jgi:hypothetical protein
MRKILLTLLLMFPAISQAGPWCLVRDEIVNCKFLLANDCYEAVANSTGGSCRPNYREMGVQGEAQWCLVTAQFRRCTYSFKTSCIRAARTVNGGCVENLELALFFSDKRQDFEVASCEGDFACEREASMGSGMESSMGSGLE